MAFTVPAGRVAHVARDLDHELVAQPFGLLEDRREIRVEHDLQQPFAVAHVDENHAAVVAPAMHPAGDRDLLAEELFVDLSAVM